MAYSLTFVPEITKLFAHQEHAQARATRPGDSNAYLIAGGIASLAAAIHLIHDAHMPANQIHILEAGPLPGGSMDGAGDAEKGYVLRGGRMLNFSYLCLYDLLSTVPSLSNSKKTVMDEISEFNAIPVNKTHSNARLVANGDSGPEIMNVKKLGLSHKDKKDLFYVTIEPEHSLGTKRINECFQPSFFSTKFWYMWATMFAFQPWHSAVEFRRYLHRFVHEFPRINTLAGVDRTPLNQYDSIIRPIEAYLKSQGVQFRYGTRVTELSFLQATPNITAHEIHFTLGGPNSDDTGIIHVEPHDIVIVTIGSMTASSSLGSDTAPPAPISSLTKTLDPTWALWNSLAATSRKSELFGKPENFYSRPEESNWLSFTVTLHNTDFFNRLVKWTRNTPGTGALFTLKDSAWLMSIVVPQQPHFLNQPSDVQVFWGYGLLPSEHGNYIHKPMAGCTGAEILQELLGHLNFPEHPTVEAATTIPCMMPFITSQFLTRAEGDRPEVIPTGSTNLALVGQFVEIPKDTVFTVEYSVRGAEIAVYALMGIDKEPKHIYMGKHHPKVLLDALKTLLQ